MVTAGVCAAHKPAARGWGREDARLCLLQAGRSATRQQQGEV